MEATKAHLFPKVILKTCGSLYKNIGSYSTNVGSWPTYVSGNLCLMKVTSGIANNFRSTSDIPTPFMGPNETRVFCRQMGLCDFRKCPILESWNLRWKVDVCKQTEMSLKSQVIKSFIVPTAFLDKSFR